MQIVKSALLENSRDPLVRSIYDARKARVVSHPTRWSGPKALQNLEPMASHMFKFAGQGDRAGLGSSPVLC